MVSSNARLVSSNRIIIIDESFNSGVTDAFGFTVNWSVKPSGLANCTTNVKESSLALTSSIPATLQPRVSLTDPSHEAIVLVLNNFTTG